MPKGYPDTQTCESCGAGLPADFAYCPDCGNQLFKVKVPRKHEFVQTINPMTHKWVVIDKTLGTITKHSRTSKPYKNIPIAAKND